MIGCSRPLRECRGHCATFQAVAALSDPIDRLSEAIAALRGPLQRIHGGCKRLLIPPLRACQARCRAVEAVARDFGRCGTVSNLSSGLSHPIAGIVRAVDRVYFRIA
jgi:hypothetical protein